MPKYSELVEVPHIQKSLADWQAQGLTSWQSRGSLGDSSRRFGYGLGTYGLGVYGIGEGILTITTSTGIWQIPVLEEFATEMAKKLWQDRSLQAAIGEIQKITWQAKPGTSEQILYFWGVGRWGTGDWGKGEGRTVSVGSTPWAQEDPRVTWVSEPPVADFPQEE